MADAGELTCTANQEIPSHNEKNPSKRSALRLHRRGRRALENLAVALPLGTIQR